MKRVALIAGMSIAAFSAASTDVRAWSGDFDGWPTGYRPASAYRPPSLQSSRTRLRKPDRIERKVDKTPPIPSWTRLHIIVSIDKQRATLFADGASVASTAISSGTPDHPTPMGVFTVIQKDRHHISNLYDAPMPYMQRITWSGSALHEGPLPGYPASHGCVRLTPGFAQLLWKATKMGARVIVTHPDVAPLAFEHARLFVPKLKMVEAPDVPLPAPKPTASAAAGEPATASTAAKIRTADAANTIPATIKSAVETAAAADGHSADAMPTGSTPAVRANSAAGPSPTPPDAAPVVEAKPAPASAAPAPIVVDERPKEMPATVAKEANARPISVFVSLKEGKLYVRQGWKPLFDAPVRFEHPEQPIGTHVYTAMGFKVSGDGLRWTVVSIPSSSRAGRRDQESEQRPQGAPRARQAGRGRSRRRARLRHSTASSCRRSWSNGFPRWSRPARR